MRFVFFPMAEHKSSQHKTYRMETAMFLAINLLIERIERIFYGNHDEQSKTIRR